LENNDWITDAYAGGAVFVAFDLETTGLDPRLDKIVEIGAVKFDRSGIIARFSTLINPGIPMPPEAGKVNNITDEMLAKKPSLDDVLPDFIHFIRGAILAAHNAAFDCGFINEKLREWQTSPFPSLPNRVVDTLAVSREKFPGLGSYSLQKLAAELGIPSRDAHRAEDDARLCMEILLRCVEAPSPGV
jgi:DNA polymerase-3 subunit epsilon